MALRAISVAVISADLVCAAHPKRLTAGPSPSTTSDLTLPSNQIIVYTRGNAAVGHVSRK
ncbi:MAG TPA: hypothetical protein VGN92_12275 [Mycobacterium sp.]|nr:hypothetical protein [Mycobacterium sp.]